MASARKTKAVVRIDRLTPAQKARLPEWRDKWIKIGLSTEPADRSTVERAVRNCYRHADLDGDGLRVEWAASPSEAARIVRDAVWGAVGGAVGGAVWGAVWGAVGGAVWDAVWGAVGGAVWGAVWGAVGDAVRGAVGGAVGGAVRGAVRGAVWDAVWDAVGGAVGDAVRGAVRGAVWDAVWDAYHGGQFWCDWPAHESYFRQVCGLVLLGDRSQRAADCVDLYATGSMLLFHDLAVLIDRPRAIRLVDGRLHCETGPAVEWRDGTGIYAWRGVVVPERLVMAPESYTATEIADERNSEIVRALAERLGWPAFLAKTGSSIVDTWTDPATGLEYELREPAHRRARQPRLLRMRSPTLNDGSQPWYIEPVDPGLKTAAAARKWQFAKAPVAGKPRFRHGDVDVIYVDDEGQALEVDWPSVEECNREPHGLVFAWEA